MPTVKPPNKSKVYLCKVKTQKTHIMNYKVKLHKTHTTNFIIKRNYLQNNYIIKLKNPTYIFRSPKRR